MKYVLLFVLINPSKFTLAKLNFSKSLFHSFLKSLFYDTPFAILVYYAYKSQTLFDVCKYVLLFYQITIYLKKIYTQINRVTIILISLKMEV